MSEVAATAPRDDELLARLRMGDEAAFMELVDRYGALMLRIALSHVSSRAVAEEVVQDAWLGASPPRPRPRPSWTAVPTATR